jgi:hypothetical protein
MSHRMVFPETVHDASMVATFRFPCGATAGAIARYRCVSPHVDVEWRWNHLSEALRLRELRRRAVRQRSGGPEVHLCLAEIAARVTPACGCLLS